jgi:hypothetical protein
MLEHMFCPVCGEEMVFDYITPTKSFRLGENGEIVRDDNNLSDKPYVEFYCSGDREHDVEDTKKANIWREAVEFDFYERGLYI